MASKLPVWCVCVVVLLLATSPPVTPTPIDWSSIVGNVASTASEILFNQEELSLFGNYCTLSRRPYFKKFELHYRTSVHCPGWTTIVGKAHDDRSPVNSERKATQDFVKQALERGLITQEEADPFLGPV